jgi:hypothetical protein
VAGESLQQSRRRKRSPRAVRASGVSDRFLNLKTLPPKRRNISKHARVRSAAELERNVRCSCPRQTSEGPRALTYLLRDHWCTVV